MSQLTQSSNGFGMSHKVRGSKVNPFPERCAYFHPEYHISKPSECRVPCSSSGSCDKAVTGRVDWPLFNPTVLKLHTSVLSQGMREIDLSHHLVSEFSSLNVFVTDFLYERSNEHSGHCCIVTVTPLPQQTFNNSYVYNTKLCITE